jgi:hypothetical protein
MKYISTTRNIALALLATSSIVMAAPAKKPATRKPAAKAVAKPKLIREVMGTEQLVGYEGTLGQTFTIGKETAVNFTLRKAEYTVGRVNIGGYSHLPSGDEKFLVLHFTIHNPHKKPFTFSSSYLIIKAVDAQGVTRNALNDIAREVTAESVNFPLQPGQKVDVYTAIKVSAFGEVPKVIVQNNYDREAPIVRYDLRGKAGKLIAPFADPADPKGATSPKVIPAVMGTAYPVTDNFDLSVDKITYSTEPMGGRKPENGKHYCVATVTITNRAKKPVRYGQSYFRADLKDMDGEKVNYNTYLQKASRDEDSSAELAPGEEARARFFWVLPANVKAKSVLLQYGYDRESRTYAVDVEGKE